MGRKTDITRSSAASEKRVFITGKRLCVFASSYFSLASLGFLASVTVSLMFSTSFSATVHATELPHAFTHPSAAAMGGAYTAVANDDSAVWTNPAGISRIKKARSRDAFQLLRAPQFFIGTNSASDFAELSSLQGRHLFAAQGWDKDINNDYIQMGSFADGMPDLKDLESSLLERFQDDPESSLWGRFDIGALAVLEIEKGWGLSLGLFTTSQGTLSVGDAAVTSGSQVDANTLVRYTDIINIMPVIGTSFSNKSKRVNFGIQARPMIRHSYSSTNALSMYGDTDLITTELRDNSNEDSAVAYDMGFMWTLADFWYPTLAVAVYNLPTGCKSDYLNPYDQTVYEVCGTKFESSTTADPTSLANLDPTDIRAGFSISPRMSRKMAIRISADYHYIELSSGDTYYGLPSVPESQKTHFGFEFYFGNPVETPPFRVKAGLNQGMFTFGGNMDFKYFQMDFAAYGVDLSDDDTPNEDRRYLLSLSSGF